MSDSYPFRSQDARERYLAHYESLAEAWPLASERMSVHTDEGDTHVWVTGAADLAPLVLLPGAWGHALSWPASMIERLASRFRVYAVDNICDVGCSVSSRPLKSAPEFMGWLDGLFDALGFSDPVSLMGLSRGGWLTGEYLLHAPQRLAAAVLLSPALVVIGPAPKSMTSMPYSIGCLIAPSARTVGGLMRQLMPYWSRSDPRAFDDYVSETVLALRSFDTRKVCRFLGPRTFSDDELRSINVPTLYMAGRDEVMSSSAAAATRLTAGAPSFESVVFPDAGHDLVAVHDEAVARRVLEFLGAHLGFA